jgi:hypothetical protein
MGKPPNPSISQSAPDSTPEAGELHADKVAAANAAGQVEANALFNGFDITKLPPILISCVAKLWPGSNGLFWEAALEKMPERIEHLMANAPAANGAGRFLALTSSGVTGYDEALCARAYGTAWPKVKAHIAGLETVRAQLRNRDTPAAADAAAPCPETKKDANHALENLADVAHDHGKDRAWINEHVAAVREAFARTPTATSAAALPGWLVEFDGTELRIKQDGRTGIVPNPSADSHAERVLYALGRAVAAVQHSRAANGAGGQSNG